MSAPASPSLRAARALAWVALAVNIAVIVLGPRYPMQIVWASVPLQVLGAAGVAWGLAEQRVPLRNPWWLACGSLAIGAAGHSLRWVLPGARDLLIIPAPLVFFNAAMYITAFGAIAWLNVFYVRPYARAALLDYAAATVAAVTVLGSIAQHKFGGGGWDAFAYLVFPASDTVLCGIAARLWFSRGGRLPALNFLCLGLLTVLIGNTFAFATPGTMTQVNSASLLWLGFTPALMFSATDRSVTLAPADTRVAPHEVTGWQIGVLALLLLVPWGALAVSAAVHVDPPWLAISGGGLVGGALVATRFSRIVTTARRMAVQADFLSRHDALTGVPHRGYWDAATAHLTPAADGVHATWIAMIDVDHFKAFNDRYGHQAGDDLLRYVAQAWLDELRGHGFLARYGGEEFAVCLLWATDAEALDLVARLRARVPDGQTCSAGLARWAPGEDVASVLRRADDSLFAAKRSGRDRALVASRVD